MVKCLVEIGLTHEVSGTKVTDCSVKDIDFPPSDPMALAQEVYKNALPHFLEDGQRGRVDMDYDIQKIPDKSKMH